MAEAAEKKGINIPVGKIIGAVVILVIVVIAILFAYNEYQNKIHSYGVVEIVSPEKCSIEHTYKTLDYAINHTYKIEAEAINVDITFKCPKCGFEKHSAYKGSFSEFFVCKCEEDQSNFCIVGYVKPKN